MSLACQPMVSITKHSGFHFGYEMEQSKMEQSYFCQLTSLCIGYFGTEAPVLRLLYLAYLWEVYRKKNKGIWIYDVFMEICGCKQSSPIDKSEMRPNPGMWRRDFLLSMCRQSAGTNTGTHCPIDNYTHIQLKHQTSSKKDNGIFLWLWKAKGGGKCKIERERWVIYYWKTFAYNQNQQISHHEKLLACHS